jgi:protein-L-isoaspartate O-methyltransferase
MAIRLARSQRSDSGCNFVQDERNRVWHHGLAALSSGGRMSAYVHGYGEREQRRLQDQATTLVELLHADTVYPEGSSVLEVGCGTGAQTITLARQSPGAHVTSVDVSASSLAVAEAACRSAGIRTVTFRQADLFALPFDAGSFDHVFVCFVLEHLANPEQALACLRHMIKPGGTITVIEGDHGSAYFHPDSALAQRAIQCQVKLQARNGGNANIGRQLYPLLVQAGFALDNITVSPRMIYVDGSKPSWIEGFTRNTFTAMIEGVRDKAVAEAVMTGEEFQQGIDDLLRTAKPDGVFCYTFFKATSAV